MEIIKNLSHISTTINEHDARFVLFTLYYCIKMDKENELIPLLKKFVDDKANEIETRKKTLK